LRKMQADVIVVHRIAEHDLPDLEKAIKAVFPEDGHIVARYVQEILPRVKPFSYIARSLTSREVVGFVISTLEDRWTGHVLYLGVLPQHRGKHLGTKLMCMTLLDLFKFSSIEKVYLEVNTRNTAAIRLYAKLRFTVTRLVERYYSDGSDCYVMTLTREVYERETRELCVRFLCPEMDLLAQ